MSAGGYNGICTRWNTRKIKSRKGKVFRVFILGKGGGKKNIVILKISRLTQDIIYIDFTKDIVTLIYTRDNYICEVERLYFKYMNEIKIFNNPEFGEVRTAVVYDEPFFCLADVCKVLEIGNTSQLKTRLNKDGVISNEVGVITGTKADGSPAFQNVKMTFINESNLYKTIFQSRKPETEKFSDWVTSEVLPTIRKTGGYVNNDELFINTYLPYADESTKLIFAQTLKTVREQNETIKQQKAEIIHKEDVIIGLVEDIDLATKRQRIMQIVRFGASGNYQERYNLLYREFERKYHCNLKMRMESCTIKPKVKNKMDYIDRKMSMIPQLYEIACKLFENDVEKLKAEWESIVA